MAETQTNKEPMELPRAHLSRITWATVITIVTIILVYVVWAVWFSEPTIMR